MKEEKTLATINQMVDDGVLTREVAERYFPELAESEDEKIVKSLKKCFEWLRDEARWTDVYGSSFESIFAYIEKKGKQKLADIKPIFVVGDVMRTKEEAKKGWKDGMPVIISIDEEYYHCTNELIAIKDQDDYEYPPMNREQKTAEWSEEDKKNLEQAIYVCHQYGYTGVENWLKSHRQKLSNVDSSEKNWKPTSQQLYALSVAVEHGRTNDPCSLKELFEQLKAL